MLDAIAGSTTLAQAALFALTLLVAPTLAIWRGGGPERACTLALAGKALMQDIASGSPVTVADVGHAQLAIDMLALAALLGIALKANRFYPMVLSSCALIAVMGHALHAARLVDGPNAPYAALVAGPGFIALPALMLGIIAHIRREDRIGPYPDWRLAFA